MDDNILAELNAALAEGFVAEEGCAVGAQGVGVSLSPHICEGASGSSRDLISLIVHIYSTVAPVPFAADDKGADRLMLLACLEALDEDDRFTRLAACRQLARLGGLEAVAELERMAKHDPDAMIRAVCESARQDLPAHPCALGDLQDWDLQLDIGIGGSPPQASADSNDVAEDEHNVFWPQGGSPREKLLLLSKVATTDKNGIAIFENIPPKARCRLRWSKTPLWLVTFKVFASSDIREGVELPATVHAAPVEEVPGRPRAAAPEPIHLFEGKLLVSFEEAAESVRVRAFSVSAETNGGELEIFACAHDQTAISVARVTLAATRGLRGNISYEAVASIARQGLAVPLRMNFEFHPPRQP